MVVVIFLLETICSDILVWNISSIVARTVTFILKFSIVWRERTRTNRSVMFTPNTVRRENADISVTPPSRVCVFIILVYPLQEQTPCCTNLIYHHKYRDRLLLLLTIPSLFRHFNITTTTNKPCRLYEKLLHHEVYFVR